ncbi:hypothetical protein ACTXT7_008143 [Hymenolepis weldensis]
MGNDALSKFAPLMMPASLTQTANGMTSKEVPSNAIDLSFQTIFQVPHLSPVPESIMNFGNSLPQNQMLINHSASPRGNTNGEFSTYGGIRFARPKFASDDNFLYSAEFRICILSFWAVMHHHHSFQGFSPSEYFPLLEQISRVPTAAQEGKELLKKFSSFHECGHAQCRAAGLKEHFHCNDCYKVINRREETIRHAKWHRKRAESLQYGFMRNPKFCGPNPNLIYVYYLTELCLEKSPSESDNLGVTLMPGKATLRAGPS